MTHRTQYDDLSDAELVRVLQKEATLLQTPSSFVYRGDVANRAIPLTI
jgi:hypothetical protein